MEMIDHGENGVYDVTYNFIVDQAITDGANEQAVSIQRIGMNINDFVENDYIENGYAETCVHDDDAIMSWWGDH